jgi:hypothetical protein
MSVSTWVEVIVFAPASNPSSRGMELTESAVSSVDVIHPARIKMKLRQATMRNVQRVLRSTTIPYEFEEVQISSSTPCGSRRSVFTFLNT